MSSKRFAQILAGLALGCAALAVLVLIGEWIGFAKKRPSEEHVTRYRISKLEILCHEYHQRFNRFPDERHWSRSLVVDLAGDKDLIETDIREVVALFYDAWGRPIRYRCPGLVNRNGFDLYSLGPNGRDDGGSGDDIGSWQHD
jgi:general secretion pathway protein G